MIAGVDQGGDGESAAGGLSREGDVRRGGAVLQEGFIGGESVVDRRRIRVLGGEPVVDGDDLGVRPPADLRGQVGGEERVPHHVHAAVEVQDNVARFDSVDGDLGGRDAAQCGCGHGHSAGSGCADSSSRSSRRCSLTSLPAGKADCRRIASRVSRCSVLTEDLPSVGVGWAALPGGLAHVSPLLKIPAGRRAAARLAARQVRRRHRIMVIRATGPRPESTMARGSVLQVPGPQPALGHCSWAGRFPTGAASTRARRARHRPAQPQTSGQRNHQNQVTAAHLDRQ